MQNDLKIIKKELFNMVYMWGKIGIVVDENAPAFQSLIKSIIKLSKN